MSIIGKKWISVAVFFLIFVTIILPVFKNRAAGTGAKIGGTDDKSVNGRDTFMPFVHQGPKGAAGPGIFPFTRDAHRNERGRIINASGNRRDRAPGNTGHAIVPIGHTPQVAACPIQVILISSSSRASVPGS